MWFDETWELAVVVMLQSDTILNSLNPRPQVSDSVGIAEYRTDFSDKFDKAKNKLTYASVFSILVGLFEYQEGSSFLGFKLNELTDNRLEWIIWFSCLFFLGNMILRFLDERRQFEKYKNEVATFQRSFDWVLDGLRSTTEEILFLLNDKNGQIRKSKTALSSKISNARLEVKSLELEKELEERAVADLNFLEHRILSEVQNIQNRNLSIAQQLSGLPDEITQFTKKQKPVREYVGYGAIRFLIFDLCSPITLFTFATLIHFFPDFQNLILSQIT